MNIEIQIAEYLLQSNAVKLDPVNPFTWASGWKSPIYCDNRKTLSYPEIRTYIRDAFIDLVLRVYGKPDLIAGVATGAIAQGVLVAEKLNLPFVYVRSSPKAHGLENLIEGELQAGMTVVVIEDLISTGGSSLKAVRALRDAGCIVKGMAAIFTYGFAKAEENFRENKCQLVTLTNYDILISHALSKQIIKQDHMETLKIWRKDPQNWLINNLNNKL